MGAMGEKGMNAGALRAKDRCPMRPGLWTGMFRKCEVPLPRATELLREAGFECAELCERYASDSLADGSWERVEPALPLTQCHATRLPDEATRDPAAAVAWFRPWCAMLSRWNVETCVFHPFGASDAPGAVAANVRVFGAIAALAADSGIRIALENLISFRAAALVPILDAAPALGINVDSAHALAAGDRPEEVIGAFAGRVFGVHLSDSDGEPRDLHLIPGRGIADWPAILAALRRSGYDGDFHLELPQERVADDIAATFERARAAAVAARGILAMWRAEP